VKSIESTTDPAGKVQALIENQLQEFRLDILKFDEISAENRKAQDLNAVLNNRLAAEREKAQEMNERIDTLQDEEEELTEQKVQLECQLAELDGKLRDRDTDISGLQKGTEDLRRQLMSVKDDCDKTKAEIERLQKNIRKRDQKIADYDVSRSHSFAQRSANTT
jgi:chromosome segregation ATPase